MCGAQVCECMRVRMFRYFSFTMCTAVEFFFLLLLLCLFDLAYVIDVYIDILYMNVWRVYDSFFFGLFFAYFFFDTSLTSSHIYVRYTTI